MLPDFFSYFTSPLLVLRPTLDQIQMSFHICLSKVVYPRKQTKQANYGTFFLDFSVPVAALYIPTTPDWV